MGKVGAIILASGAGLRFNDRQPKQFMKLAGLPILVHTLRVFQTSLSIDDMVVVCHVDYIDAVWELVRQHGISKVAKVVAGGQTRQESSRIGVACCGHQIDHVLIHDSVRPFVTHRILDALVAAVRVHGAVDTVIPSADTLVEVDAKGFIRTIPDRSRFRRGQTPQAFALPLITEAHHAAAAAGVENATDDCALVLRLGHQVFTVEGDEQNIKITYPLDLHLADKLFQLKMQSFSEQDDLRPDWSNKVVVVIGGTSGIGLALCDELAKHAAIVHQIGRSTEVQVDIRKPETIEKAVSTIFAQNGRIDFVINCSGDLIRKDVEYTTAEEWQHIYDTNITGNFHLARIVIPLFKQQHGGSLMFIGSSSYTRGRGGYAAYSSSKAALVNFCQALSEEVAAHNIQVNVVSPGRVRTPLRYRNFGEEDPGTLLTPGQVARQIVHALSMQTTGSVFEVH